MNRAAWRTPLTKVTIPEQIAAALRHDIVTGHLAAGTRLRQVEIAHRFGVSTTPVREAFGLLQSDGLVRIDTHRGVTVFLPTIEDLIEHYEIRRALEMLAVEKAAERFQTQDAPPLIAILDEMRDTQRSRSLCRAESSVPRTVVSPVGTRPIGRHDRGSAQRLTRLQPSVRRRRCSATMPSGWMGNTARSWLPARLVIRRVPLLRCAITFPRRSCMSCSCLKQEEALSN